MILSSPSRLRAHAAAWARLAPAITLAAALAAMAGCATPVSAQLVTGRLLDAETGEPVVAAFVTLRDSAGRAVAGALGDQHGAFRIQAPGAGTYTVTVERLGYSTFASEPLPLGATGTLVREFRLPTRAISLPTLQAEADRQCRGRRDMAVAAATVWEEVRKALAVTEWTRRSGRPVRYSIVASERRLEPRTLEVLSETVTREQVDRDASPYVAVPLPVLMGGGFIQRAEDGDYIYYAPDARVLLADEFLDAHCFQAVTDASRPDMVGLRFEPAQPRDVTGIRGVLWVRRDSWELSHVEFRYTALPWRVPAGNTGGHVGFTRLPNGAWIVSDWWVRAPVVTMHQDREGRLERLELSSIHEFRREIEAALAADGTPIRLRH